MPPDLKTLMTSTRRHWVKHFMLGTAATLSGPGWLGTAVAEVTPSNPGPAVVRLKAADVRAMIENDMGIIESVAVLAEPGGSIQFDFNSGLHPFTLNRVATDRFVTLDSVCTHRGCFVGRYKSRVVGLDESVNPPVPVLADLMRCPCHGSRYDIEGRVFRDADGQSTEPAPADLARYLTSYDVATDIVSITLPGVSLQINAIRVYERGPGNTVRLQLVIPLTAFSRYEIVHCPDLSGPFVRICFATTAAGPADQTELSTSTSREVTIYVEAVGTSGFFAVALLLEDVAP